MQFALGVLTPSLLRQPSKKTHKKYIHTYQILDLLTLGVVTRTDCLIEKLWKVFAFVEASTPGRGWNPQNYMLAYNTYAQIQHLDLFKGLVADLISNFLEYISKD